MRPRLECLQMRQSRAIAAGQKILKGEDWLRANRKRYLLQNQFFPDTGALLACAIASIAV